ncbi:MAG: DUF29 domain-containing protein, partial [Gloeomargarita sp. SKYG98]|nr:DUF29 domain-containing protein [Gloeomargarita sp. SKYG98]
MWEHLLKRCYVPAPEYYIGWEREIRTFRNDIQDLLVDSPSLKNVMAQMLPQVFSKALATVRQEYPQVAFPD